MVEAVIRVTPFTTVTMQNRPSLVYKSSVQFKFAVVSLVVITEDMVVRTTLTVRRMEAMVAAIAMARLTAAALCMKCELLSTSHVDLMGIGVLNEADPISTTATTEVFVRLPA